MTKGKRKKKAKDEEVNEKGALDGSRTINPTFSAADGIAHCGEQEYS